MLFSLFFIIQIYSIFFQNKSNEARCHFFFHINTHMHTRHYKMYQHNKYINLILNKRNKSNNLYIIICVHERTCVYVYYQNEGLVTGMCVCMQPFLKYKQHLCMYLYFFMFYNKYVVVLCIYTRIMMLSFILYIRAT